MSETKNRDQNKRSSGFRLVIPFFIVLGLMTVVSFIIPLRPTVSNSEKRELAKFPEFSVNALLDGSYFDDITTWFSDTFPGRESWITMSNYISSIHGYSEITIEGDLPIVDEIPDIPEIPIPTKPVEISAPAETETAEETSPATEAEEEEEWGGVTIENPEEINLGAVIQIGDAAFNYLGFSQNNSERYARVLSTYASAVKGLGVRVVSAPCPTAVGIMVPEEYLDAMRCSHQDQVIDFMHGCMTDDVITVDTWEALIDHNDEYIYFRTDHHWTALGAYYSYRAVCEALGYEPAPLDFFEVWNQGDFHGSIYGKCNRPHQLKTDTVDAYIPQGDITMMVYPNSPGGYEMPLLQDCTERAINAKYLTFLSSDNAISVITNDSLPDGPSCVVIKDSFGNCFVPFLTQNYHKIYALDYRKYSRDNLIKFVEKYDVDDVLFIPYLTGTQSGQGVDLISNHCS